MLDRQIESNNKVISIRQDLSLSHAGTVWDGALCMIKYLNKNKQIAKQYLQNKNVLQLGSGTGILGLACSLFNPRKVILTDLPQYLSLIQENKQKNSNILAIQAIEIRGLIWQNSQDIKNVSQQFFIESIIGSQISYDKDCTEKLLKTLIKFRQINPKLKVIICYQKYTQQAKNIQIQFKKYFHVNQYHLIDWNMMDSQFRDQNIGIITLNHI